MKTNLRSALLASLLLCGSSLLAQTGIPRGISYQATITDETGSVIAPLPGAAIQYNITLQVFDSASDGTLKWAEIFNGIPVSNGRFSVILGQGVPDPGAGITNPTDLATIFDEQDRFVEISVVPTAGGAPKTFKPRQQLLATPTAMRARFAEVAQGFSPELQGQFNAKAPVTNPSFQGTVGIDSSSSNTGTLLPGLRFGDPTSLEGISSKRTPGVGQYGLSFYTGNQERMTLSNTGLNVAGRLEAGSANIGGLLAGSAIIAGNLGLGGSIDAGGEIRTASSLVVDSGNTNNGNPAPGLRFGNAESKEGITSRRTAGFGQNGLTFFTNDLERMTITNAGRVGIGTESPEAVLHVRGTGVVMNGDSNFMIWTQGNGSGTQDVQSNPNVVAYFEGNTVTNGRVASQFVTSFSDGRAKKIISRSDGAEDLGKLNQLRITDYHWINQSTDGGKIHKKVIAQEVEKVLPNAITQMSQAIPNVYKKSTALNFESGQLTLTVDQSHEFSVGDLVDVFTDAVELRKAKVLAVGSPTQFTIACEEEPKEAFVYGKWVDDFRTVDYDAIAMLNVSATQELHRRLEAKTREIEEMKKEMAALKGLVSNLQTKDETRENRLIAIEKLLTRDREPVKTVSK